MKDLRSLRIFLVVLILSCLSTAFGQGNWIATQRSGDTVHFLFQNRIERYALPAERFLAPLPLAGPSDATAFSITPEAIWVAYGAQLWKYDPNFGNGVHFTTISGPVDGPITAIIARGDMLFLVHSPRDRFRASSVRISTGERIALEEEFHFDLDGVIYSPRLGRLFGRYLGYVAYLDWHEDGTFGSPGEAPLSSSDATQKVWLFPDETLLVDGRGTIYETDLPTDVGTFPTRIHAMDFHGRVPIVVRSGRMIAFDDSLEETGSVELGAEAHEVFVSGAAAFAFWQGSNSRLAVRKVPLSDLSAPEPDAPVEPEGLKFEPAEILHARDGVVLLHSRLHRAIFRWSSAEFRFLGTIPLPRCFRHVTYNPVNHCIYLIDGNSVVARVDANGDSPFEDAIADLPGWPDGLEAVGNHIWVSYYPLPVEFRRATLGLDGSPVFTSSSSLFWSWDSSSQYEWNEALRRIICIDSSRELNFAPIAPDGTLSRSSGHFFDDFSLVGPVRANASGSRVATGNGMVLDTSAYPPSLSVLGVLPGRQDEMAWRGEQLLTLDDPTSGTTRFRSWTDGWAVDREVTLPGAPRRVFSMENGSSLVVTLSGGRPRFHLLDGEDAPVFDSIPEAPSIAVPPRGTRIDYGGTVALEVQVSGGAPFHYEWSRDGVPLPGRDSSRLLLENCGSDDAGWYRVTVTNASGSATTDAVPLGVGPVRSSVFQDAGLIATGENTVRGYDSALRPSGTLALPPLADGKTFVLRDAVVDRFGRLHLTGDLPGDRSRPLIRTWDPEFGYWSETRDTRAGGYNPLFGRGDVDILGDWIVTSFGRLHLTEPRGIFYPNTTLDTLYNISAGADGRLFATAESTFELDADTWHRAIPPILSLHDTGRRIAAMTSGAGGDLVFITSNSGESPARFELGRRDAQGRLAYAALPYTENDFAGTDIHLSRDGRILAGGREGKIFMTNKDFGAFTEIRFSSDDFSTYTAWVEPDPVPTPLIAGPALLGADEDSLFSYTPSITHADPDAVISTAFSGLPEWLRALPDGSISGTPLASDVGTHSFHITATDAFGETATRVIEIEVIEVNDRPAATDGSAAHPEDSPPFGIGLAAYFDDEETPDDLLAYGLSGHTGSGAVEAEIIGGTLRVRPVPDAFGTDIIRVIATDQGGLEVEAEFAVTITPVNDPPTFPAGIPAQHFDAAGSPLTLDLRSLSRDADPGDLIRWSIEDVSNPGILSRIEIDARTGQLHLESAPWVGGTTTVTLRVSDRTSSSETTFTIGLPEPPLPGLAAGSVLHFNRQTGLYEQDITVTNEALREIAGFDLLIGALPEGVGVNNASGRLGDMSVISHHHVMAPGETVTLRVEYFSEIRGVSFEPRWEIRLVTAPGEDAVAAGTGFAIDRCLFRPDGSVLIEFTATPGKTYEIQYSDDAAGWKTSPVPIRAAGNRVMWIDRGPPRTDSPPAARSRRFYRVSELGGE